MIFERLLAVWVVVVSQNMEVVGVVVRPALTAAVFEPQNS